MGVKLPRTMCSVSSLVSKALNHVCSFVLQGTSNWMKAWDLSAKMIIVKQDLKTIKNVKGCRDGMPKSVQTR